MSTITETLNAVQGGDPFVSFLVSDIDDAGIVYIGSVAMNGVWVIKSFDSAIGQMRYAVGVKDYSSNWANRASLVYTLPTP